MERTAQGKIKRYVVAPGYVALLCERCTLRTATREEQETYKFTRVIPHAAWVARGGHGPGGSATEGRTPLDDEEEYIDDGW